MGAEKINLEELRKAREELDIERGITPKPEKKPVQKVEESKSAESEKTSDETFSAQNETTEDALEIHDEVEEEIDEEVEEPTIESSDNEEPTDVEEPTDEEKQNLESKIGAIAENVESETEKVKNDFDDILLTLLNDAPDEDEVDDKYNVDEIAVEVEKEVETEPEPEFDEIIEEDSTFEEEPEQEEIIENIQSEPVIPIENAEKPAFVSKKVEEKVEKTAKPVEFTEKNIEKEDKTPENDEEFELKPIYVPNFDVNVGAKTEEQPATPEKLTDKQDEKLEEEAVEFPIIDVEKAKNEEQKEDAEKEEVNENALKKIEDAKFISLIRTKEFMGSDSLTCIYGVDEEKNVFCQNFKDFYNTAIFTDNDENVFELFSSIMMSLLLKNTNYDVKFAICDAKIGGKFSVYNNLSYMFFDRIAESNREIIEALNEINLEIESRYKTLAKAGSNSIEKFNSEMKKANIAPMPYLLLFFNNYSRAYHLDDSNEINSKLSYILRFGRLVGVYANIVSFDENLVENINFNLQTRIAYKADLKETSITEIGEEGAENIAYNDEFIIKTLYSDKLIHLKAPKITQKEIELLIKNIEKK